MAERIEVIQAVSAPGSKVTLIAHSMGGLLAQYYLMYGAEDALKDSNVTPDYAGAAQIDKAFFLGVPFGGTPMAFKSLQEGEWIGPGLTIFNWATFTMPSIYQLLPFSDRDLFVDIHDKNVSIDLSKVSTWLELDFSIFQHENWNDFQRTCQISFPDSGPELAHHLEQQYQTFFQSALNRGVLFQSALDQIDWGQISSDIFVVTGNCQQTLEQIRLTKEGSQRETHIVQSRFFNEHYWLGNDGDGVVLASSMVDIEPYSKQVFKSCFHHRTMPNQKAVIQFILENL